MAGSNPNIVPFDLGEPDPFQFVPDPQEPRDSFDVETNTRAVVPFDFGPNEVAREAQELNFGRDGKDFFGNTDISPFMEFFGATGGVAEPADIQKTFGSLQRTTMELITGSIRQRALISAERLKDKDNTLEDIARDTTDSLMNLFFGAQAIGRGEFKEGFQREIRGVAGLREQTFGRLGQALSPMSFVMNQIIQDDPERAREVADAMESLQRANEDFLIRNGLMFGPDDEPTLVGTAFETLTPSISMITLAVMLRRPEFAVAAFAALQQIEGFERAEEAGFEPTEAALVGTLEAVPEAAINAFELGYILKGFEKASVGTFSAIGRAFAGEALEEGTTDLAIIGIEELAEISNLTTDEVWSRLLRSTVWGGIGGVGFGGGIAIGQRLTGLPQKQQDAIQEALDLAAKKLRSDAAGNFISDFNVEQLLGNDAQSDAPVTKAAKNKRESEAQMVELLAAMNEGDQVQIQKVFDKINPEQRIAREKRKLETQQQGRDVGVVSEALRGRTRILQQQLTQENTTLARLSEQFETEFREFSATVPEGQQAKARTIQFRPKRLNQQIATSQERIRGISDELGRIEQVAQIQPGVTETVEELGTRAVLTTANRQFNQAVTLIDETIRGFETGLRTGRQLQKQESTALQRELGRIIDVLPIADNVKNRLKNKLRDVNTLATARTIRSDIIPQARGAALRSFVYERRKAITQTITTNATAKDTKAKLDADSQNAIDSLNRIRKDFLASRKGDERQTQTAEMLATAKQSVYSRFNEGIPTAGQMLQVRYLDILGQARDVTPIDVAQFEDDLNAFIETGKGNATVSDALTQQLLDLTKGQIIDGQAKALRSDLDANLAVDAEEVFQFFGRNYQTVVNILGMQGTLFDTFQVDVQFRDRVRQANRERLALANTVTNGSGGSYLAQLNSSRNIAINRNREGLMALGAKGETGISMTRGELVYSWMLLREPSINEQLTDPDGATQWSEEFVSLIENTVTDEDIAFADGLFQIYERNYDRFNAVYRRLNNRDLPKVEFYSHIRRLAGDESAIAPASVHEETSFLELITGRDSSDIQTGEPSQAKERKKNATKEILIDNVINSFDRYHYDVEHYIAYAETLDLMRVLLNDSEVRTHLRDILGEAGLRTFEGHIEIYTRANRANSAYARLVQRVGRRVEGARRNLFGATLGANIKLGFPGQLSSVFANAAGMPKGSFAAGIADFHLHPIRSMKILKQHSTFAERGKHFDQDIAQMGNVGRLFRFFSLPIRVGDAWAVYAGSWSRYTWLIETQGKTNEQAIDEVARLAERSQQSTLPGQLTRAQKASDPVTRTLTMYRSSLSAMFNMSAQSIADYRNSDRSFSEKKKLIETLTIQNFVIPAVFTIGTGGSAASIGLGSSGAIPFVSSALQVIMASVANLFAEEDEKVFTEGELEVPVIAAFEDALDILNEAIEDPSTEIFIEAIEKGLEITKGIPASNIVDMGQGFKMIMDEEDPIKASLMISGYSSSQADRMLKRLGQENTGSARIPGERTRR